MLDSVLIDQMDAYSFLEVFFSSLPSPRTGGRQTKRGFHRGLDDVSVIVSTSRVAIVSTSRVVWI